MTSDLSSIYLHRTAGTGKSSLIDGALILVAGECVGRISYHKGQFQFVTLIGNKIAYFGEYREGHYQFSELLNIMEGAKFTIDVKHKESATMNGSEEKLLNVIFVSNETPPTHGPFERRIAPFYLKPGKRKYSSEEQREHYNEIQAEAPFLTVLSNTALDVFIKASRAKPIYNLSYGALFSAQRKRKEGDVVDIKTLLYSFESKVRRYV